MSTKKTIGERLGGLAYGDVELVATLEDAPDSVPCPACGRPVLRLEDGHAAIPLPQLRVTEWEPIEGLGEVGRPGKPTPGLYRMDAAPHDLHALVLDPDRDPWCEGHPVVLTHLACVDALIAMLPRGGAS